MKFRVSCAFFYTTRVRYGVQQDSVTEFQRYITVHRPLSALVHACIDWLIDWLHFQQPNNRRLTTTNSTIQSRWPKPAKLPTTSTLVESPTDQIRSDPSYTHSPLLSPHQTFEIDTLQSNLIKASIGRNHQTSSRWDATTIIPRSRSLWRTTLRPLRVKCKFSNSARSCHQYMPLSFGRIPC